MRLQNCCGKMQDLDESVTELLLNNDEDFIKVATELIKLMKAIEDGHREDQYTKINLASSLVVENLLPYNGGLNCLFSVGFSENEDHLVFDPDNQGNRRKLGQVKRQIVDQLNKKIQKSQKGSTSISKETKADSPIVKLKYERWVFPTLPNEVELSERFFFEKIRTSFDHVLCYEDESLQAKARHCIPSTRLKQKATEKYNFSKREGDIVFGLDEFYLIELMDWYRDEFFRWMNTPDCTSCSGKTSQVGMAEPNSEERRWWAARVELYKCVACNAVSRFPRYNHPGKLLETRVGRCGEWANTFTLICRASGYEARHVVDWTDHVWTEVFSKSLSRWLHCDPGEKALDKPLVYEAGWGKKLNYIIAFSKDDINDVTWRYSANHKDLVLRRTLCREKNLLNMIKRLREERQRNMPPDVRKMHEIRLIKEGAEFMCSQQRKVSAGELIGRLTGSEEWRQSRGETGHPRFTFSPTPQEVNNGLMAINYSCVRDEYRRNATGETWSGWRSCAFECTDMLSKVEVDWNMVYLARLPGSQASSISWRFDTGNCTKLIEKVKIHVSSATFQTGSVRWRLENDKGHKTDISANESMESGDLKGCQWFIISASLSGGEGDSAWQHTQLFRQSRNAHDLSMSVEIYFQ